MREAAEFLHIVDGIVVRNAHDGAHLVAASVVLRAAALAADVITGFQNGIIPISFLFQIHTCGETCRPCADNTDFHTGVHKRYLPFPVSALFRRVRHMTDWFSIMT